MTSAFSTETIQAVLDSAVNGDTVQFAAGTYTITDELLIKDKGITLQGMGKATGTIIQRAIGVGSHRIFNVTGIQGTTEAPYDPALGTTINGFTVKNGLVTGIGVNGGNILVKESPHSVVENCIIEGGQAPFGGGISMEVGGTLLNSIVRNNSTNTNSLNQGGGVYMRHGANFVQNSIIYGNLSVVGGGVGLQFGGDEIDPAYDGDGRNRVVNSTITNNSATGYYGYFGDGVGAQPQGHTSLLADSIVTFNLNEDIVYVGSGGGTLNVTYTNANVDGAPYGGIASNITTDPLFVGSGEAWDYYRLQTGSPSLTGSSTGGVMGAVLDQSMFVVPEPSITILVGLAGFALLMRRRRQLANS